MNHSSPIISISMLLSGRKDTTRKCLECFNTLRKRVPSELIIVDTSENHELLPLYREFTDIIIPFEWCNDFSKARNAGIEVARGEWFMFMDDDEWFLDTKDIEEFFVTGKYKEYTSADYRIRNYTKLDNSCFHDSYGARMCQLDKDTKFIGRIHEVLTIKPGRKCILESMTHHYGYAFKNEEEEKRHMIRNVSLLKISIAEDRENYHAWEHLINEYVTNSDFTNVVKCCNEVLEIIDCKSSERINHYLPAILCSRMLGNISLEEYDKADKYIEDALSDDRVNDVAKTMIYYLMLENYYYSGRSREYVDNYHYYLKYYNKYGNKLEKYSDKAIHIVAAGLKESFYEKSQKYLAASINNYCMQQDILEVENKLEEIKQIYSDEQWIIKYYRLILSYRKLIDTDSEYSIIQECLVDFADSVNEYIQLSREYKDINENIEMLCKAGKLVSDLIACENSDITKFTECYKSLIGICPSLTHVMTEYSRIVADKYNACNSVNNMSDDMFELKKQILSQVELLISQGMNDQAIQILDQLGTMIPNDSDIINMRNFISK